MKFDKSAYENEDFSEEVINLSEPANIKFKNCSFRYADFSEVDTLFRCAFDNCDFSQVRFNGITAKDCAFLSCKFKGTSFFGAELENCKMTGSDFEEADCSVLTVNEGCDFSYTVLRKLAFVKHDLHGIRFFGADLSETRFNQCDMKNCDLSEAIVFNTSFYKSDLRGASLFSVDFANISLKDALLDITQCVEIAERLTYCKCKPLK